MRKIKIFFSGGGTGGHIIPILAVAREFKKLLPERSDFRFLGPKDQFAKKLLEREGIKIVEIPSAKIRRYISLQSLLQNLLDLFKLPFGFLKAFFYLLFNRPAFIFSKGGYGSFPVIINAWLLMIPIYLHESDVVPGLANKIAGFLAKKIFVSFPETTGFNLKKKIVVGNPIRTSLLESLPEEGKSYFGISTEKPVIFIIGGSQGAQRINEIVLSVLDELLNHFEIIHQVGENNFPSVKQLAEFLIKDKEKLKRYHLFGFLEEEELKKAFAASEIVVSRAGAGLIFEIAALGKPSILIPIQKSAQNHQRLNAYVFAQKTGAIVMEEGNITPALLLKTLLNLTSNKEKLKEMSEKAKEFGRPGAATDIANYLLYTLTKRRK